MVHKVLIRKPETSFFQAPIFPIRLVIVPFYFHGQIEKGTSPEARELPDHVYQKWKFLKSAEDFRMAGPGAEKKKKSKKKKETKKEKKGNLVDWTISKDIKRSPS